MQISCQKKFNVNSDEIIVEIFSTQEIIALNSIIEYVDNMVLSESNEKSINQAYHNYFEKLTEYIKEGSVFPAPFDETKKYEFLENLDKNTFNEIFRMDNHLKRVKYKDTILTNLNNIKMLEINSSGRYMEYLKKVGQSDEKFKQIHESIEIAGDISPSIATWFPMNHNEYDFEVVKNRLWAAVYLLRMEGLIEDKIENYLNGQ